MIDDFYASTQNLFEIVLTKESGLNSEDFLCVERRYYNATIHEYGDLRGRDATTILDSIGLPISNQYLPKPGQSIAVFCPTKAAPIMIGVLLKEEGVTPSLLTVGTAVASCTGLERNLKFPQFIDVTF